MERLTNREEERGKIEGGGYWLRKQGIGAEMEAYEKLADYEDAEDNGLLLRLPCKVGDTIYQVNSASAIDKHIVTAISIHPSKVIVCTENYRTGIKADGRVRG